MKKLSFGLLIGLGMLITTIFGCIGKLIMVCRRTKEKDVVIASLERQNKNLNKKLNSKKA